MSCVRACSQSSYCCCSRCVGGRGLVGSVVGLGGGKLELGKRFIDLMSILCIAGTYTARNHVTIVGYVVRWGMGGVWNGGFPLIHSFRQVIWLECESKVSILTAPLVIKTCMPRQKVLFGLPESQLLQNSFRGAPSSTTPCLSPPPDTAGMPDFFFFLVGVVTRSSARA